jgi:hypothetical protein
MNEDISVLVEEQSEGLLGDSLDTALHHVQEDLMDWLPDSACMAHVIGMPCLLIPLYRAVSILSGSNACMRFCF